MGKPTLTPLRLLAPIMLAALASAPPARARTPERPALARTLEEERQETPGPPARIIPAYEGTRLVGFEVVRLVISPRVVPADTDGHMAGWKFVGVGRDSAAGRLGFRSGDRIVAIDGDAVVHVAQVLELREVINADVGPHRVEVVRFRKTVTVEWWW